MSAAAGRGRPLRFTLIVLLAWAGLRAATWSDPWPLEMSPAVVLASASPEIAPVRAGVPTNKRWALPPPPLTGPGGYRPGEPLAPLASPLVPLALDRPEPLPLPERPGFAAGRAAAGHNLMWMAGMAALPMPEAVAAFFERGGREAAPQAPLPGGGLAERLGRAGRWRFDGWIAWRPGLAAARSDALQGSLLGGSQAGGILAFRLAEGRRESRSFLRVVSSRWAGEGRAPDQAAIGVRQQLLPGVPVHGQVEVRLSRQDERLQLAPAAFLVAGVDDSPLPLGVRLRAYGAAGWVGGAAPTGFVEGQAVAEREVAAFDLARVSAGAGAWGGAQAGASRLDLGPSVSATLPLGEGRGRLQLDYRVRVAGRSEPGSGPVVTLSTGF